MRVPVLTLRPMLLRVARVALAGVAMVVMLAAVARAGQRFVYCPAMAQVLAAPCCHHAAAEEPSGEPALEVPAGACSESRWMPLPPPGQGAPAPVELGAPWVAVVPPAFAVLHAGAAPPAPDEPQMRPRGAGPPDPRRYRVALSVALN